MVEKVPPEVHRGVGLDIEELDDGLLKLLLPNIQSMLQYAPLLSERKTELVQSMSLHILKAIMLSLTQLSSPAMRSLNVRVCEDDPATMTTTTTRRRKCPPSDSTIRNVIGIQCLLPIMYELLKYSHENLQDKIRMRENLSHNSQEQSRIVRAHMRQAMIFNVVLRLSSVVVPSIQLYHHLSYILRLRKTIKTPSFALNWNNLSYEYNHVKEDGRIDRKVNLLYGYRRLWYEEFMLLVSLLPLDVWKTFPNSMKVWYRYAKVRLKSMIPQKLWMGDKSSRNPMVTRENVAEHACSICNLKPVVIPYKTSCGHLCCYTCLWFEVLNQNFNYKCLVCGEKVQSSQPLVG